MAETKTRVPLTSRQIDILLGMLGTSEGELARKCTDTPDGDERTFYGNVLREMNTLSDVLRKHDPRLHDTSQDADEDDEDDEDETP